MSHLFTMSSDSIFYVCLICINDFFSQIKLFGAQFGFILQINEDICYECTIKCLFISCFSCFLLKGVSYKHIVFI